MTKESKAFRESKLIINKLLRQETMLKKRLSKIQKTKMEIIIILMGGDLNE